jgi:hypothetical protein
LAFPAGAAARELAPRVFRPLLFCVCSALPICFSLKYLTRKAKMSFSLTFDLSNLKDLNTFLQSRSYVVG